MCSLWLPPRSGSCAGLMQESGLTAMGSCDSFEGWGHRLVG